MKKTLLIAAAALAAGIISTQASSVYSQNIVGYANVPLNGGNAFNFITLPVGAGTNVETAIPGLTVGDNIFVWTGLGYNALTFLGINWDGAGNNWIDGSGNGTNSPVIAAGTGFYYQNSGSTFTNSFVGNVTLSNSVTLYGGNAFNAIASIPAIAAPVDSTNYNLTLTVGDNIFVWTGLGYNALTYLGVNWDGAGDNWIDGSGNGTNSPVIPVGAGFYYQNSGSTYTWTQNLIVQ